MDYFSFEKARGTLRIHEYSESFELWTFLWENKRVLLTVNSENGSIWDFNSCPEDLQEDVELFVIDVLRERESYV